MNKFEFYKEKHDREEARKFELNKSISIPLGIVSGIIGLNSYFIKNFDFNFSTFSTTTFLTFEFMSGVVTLITFFFLVKVYNNWFSGYEYRDLPYPTDLEGHYKDLENYYEEHFKDKSKANQKFQEELTEYYVNNVTWNSLRNDARAEYLHKANFFIVMLGILLLGCAIPFGSGFFFGEKTNFEVEAKEGEKYSQELIEIKSSIDSLTKILENEFTSRRETPANSFETSIPTTTTSQATIKDSERVGKTTGTDN